MTPPRARGLGGTCAAVLALLAPVPAAQATITGTQISSPASPAFTIYNLESPQPLPVLGMATGFEAGNKVDVRCDYGAFKPPLATNVEPAIGGEFSAEANLELIRSRTCRLRAVPSGTSPSDLSPFNGPLLAVGERESRRVVGGPNNGQIEDYRIDGQQLTGAFVYSSLAFCGVNAGNLIDATLEATTTTFNCSDWLYFYENFNGGKAASTRSELQVDGVNAYAGYSTWFINYAANGLPEISYSYTQDPSNGDLTIHETDPIVRCPNPTFPPTVGSCPSFVDTGVSDERTIVQEQDGRLTTVTDRFVSTDGKAHSLDLLWQNDQIFGEEEPGQGENVAYKFPGESSFSTHAVGDTVTLPASAPGTILVKAQGAPDGDPSSGRGAIVYDRPAGSATFNYVGEDSEFYLHQTGSIPAGGSTTFRAAYAQSYTNIGVEILAAGPQIIFANPPAPVAEPTLAQPPNAIGFGKLKLNRRNGTAKLRVKVESAGQLLLFGKQVKQRRATARGAGTVTLAVVPNAALAKKLKKTGEAKVKVHVTFTPTGGSTRTEGESLKLFETTKKT